MAYVEGWVRRAVAGDGVEECCFDTTNYCTYVEDDTKYLRIGRSKEGVVGRRLVGLALALNNQGVPVFGEAYPGNRNDVDLFSGLFPGVCERLEAAGSDLENVTFIFDRKSDGKGNFEMAWQSPLNIVAAVKRNRKTVREVLDSLEVEEFQKSYETSYGECYVYDWGRVDIGERSWRVVLSYHDSTREKVREKMDEQKQEAEEVLTESLKRLERGGPGRPPTENSVRGELEKILGKRYHCLNWSLDPKAKDLDWRWSEKWNRKYELAGILPIVTDQDDWTAGRVAKTYFQRKDIENMFHLTKKALIVSVEPPYIKEDHLIRAHLFLTFVGLLCYQHIKRKLPNTMTDDDIKSALKELIMVIATENGNLQFRLGNVNEETRPLLTAMNLEQYLPE
ncbi:hypothetical protein AKJ64_01290 [candidate division MSBL1 archaeon SCGC-AAA259E17]|uniref:Transposase IS4-like domain-containing protein n=1 Tax=candidate division MSBL1 archaeon SCGC-AAA259E17 TaxID=1698263 RepID=A0A133UG11_9EURY|nr:hypothetical protein AKJ64_01290 [candidate division MSBL1 archaeon SCGC-AAA259E17]